MLNEVVTEGCMELKEVMCNIYIVKFTLLCLFRHTRPCVLSMTWETLSVTITDHQS
jgi:hypothetical protein